MGLNGFNVDVTKLSQAGARKVTPHENCEVLELKSGDFPRYIEVRLPDDDGPRAIALWDGSLNLEVGDKVFCNEYSESTAWRIMAMGGDQSSAGKVRVSKIWNSGFGTVAAQTDATGNIEIGKLTGPDAKVEILDISGPQERLTFEDGVKYADFTVDTNHDLTIKPSSTGQIILQPTTDSIDFFQVLDADGGAPVFNVDTTGEKVSIGTADTSFVGQGSVTQNTGLFIENPDAANYHGFTLRKISDSRFTVNSMLRARAGSAAVQNGDFLGGIQFWGHDGTDYNRSSAINAVIDGAVSANNMPGAILFYTTPTNSPTERMRIAPNGDVAIGTNLPLAQLHVDQAGSTQAQPVLYLDQADVSEEMVEFNTTIGVGNAIEAVGAKTLTVTHFIKCTLPGGLTRYWPVGTIA